MPSRPDDICARPERLDPLPTQPLSPAIVPTSVWICNDTAQADALMGGTLEGYVYQRNGHPNAEIFARKCRELHAAERVALTASGMSALSAALLARLQAGDQLLVGDQLYGKSLELLLQESARLGMAATAVDPTDLDATARAVTDRTRLLVVETITNPRLNVVDISKLAELCRARNIHLLVDNTFATPILCQPLRQGADWVMESVSKMMNGHSDVMLGMLAGGPRDWDRVEQVIAAWGLASSPFEAWLATRGLSTLHLRVERACQNAQAAAELLAGHDKVQQVDYPGLPEHPQHALARQQFDNRFGTVVTFHLRGGRDGADRFIRGTRQIPFCPSLGEISTTLSHPESTSHRGMSAAQRAALGIDGGTIRLSLGVESRSWVVDSLELALRAV